MSDTPVESTSKELCFHCGLPAEPQFSSYLDGKLEKFCCIGCQLVAQSIVAGGLQQFYEYRDENNTKASAQKVSFAAYDLTEVQSEFVDVLEDGARRASISISNIACAACAWLIENYLSQIAGVRSVHVNVTLHRCSIDWEPEKLPLSEIFEALHRIGYQAYPYTQSVANDVRKKEERNALLRLGVAGLGMMQVGMVAVALHAGAIQGMDAHWEFYLRWVSLIFATPVILFSAKPFFSNAWRALRLRYLNMDVPVSLALILAFGASLWATINQSGEVYFDSVSMFTFFLLAGRFLEMRVRHSSSFATEKLTQLLPLTVEKLTGNHRETVPLKSIALGDAIWVAAGETIPCDGEVIDGKSSVDEAIVSGESMPQVKLAGDEVIAGSVNVESALTVKVIRLGQDTKLAQVESLVEKATALKPSSVALADKYSSYFVGAVIVVAFSVWLVWHFIAPEKAFWIALSVLVVTCPCALSLATPTALTAGILRMRQLGVLVASNQFIEKLAHITRVVFDKTGTLTEGRLVLSDVRIIQAPLTEQHVLHIVAALEKYSRHPIAQAFDHINSPFVASDVQVYAADGVEGRVDDRLSDGLIDDTAASSPTNSRKSNIYRFGKKEFALQGAEPELAYPSAGAWQLLSCDGVALAWVLLQDEARADVPDLLSKLDQHQLSYELLSGDRLANVEQFVSGLKGHHLDGYIADASPEVKLDHIKALQQQGEKVLMVGDGINDVPVLRGADVSLAMARSTRLAQTHADAVMVNENLSSIPLSVGLARKVNLTVKQNLGWALAYNAIALPAAAMGWIPPYLAAIGMSASSLVVVCNAWRLRFVNVT